MGNMSYYAPNVVKFKGDTGRVIIGNFASVAPDADFYVGGLHRVEWVSLYGLRAMLELPGAYEDGFTHGRGDIVVGSDTWITNGCTVMSGVTIGDGAVVGTKAVVAKDVRPVRDRRRQPGEGDRPALQRRAGRGAAADQVVGLADGARQGARRRALQPRHRRLHRARSIPGRSRGADGAPASPSSSSTTTARRLLPDCLAALAAQTLAPDEIVVADNGSRDGSLALLRAHHPERARARARPQPRLRRRRQPRRARARRRPGSAS